MTNRITRIILVSLLTAAPAAAQQTVAVPGKDNVLRERPADVFAVGTVEGRDWEMFSGIRSVAFDAADNMYLLDSQNTRVVVFDSKGRYLRQFGKKGGGPGELQTPTGLVVAADGNVVVSDVSNRGFVVFRPDGEYVRNVPFGDDTGFPIAMTASRNGGVITRSFARMRPGQTPAAETGGANLSPIVRQSLDGGAATTLYNVPVPPPRVIESGANRTVSINMDPVFGARPTFGPLASGLAVHHDTEYAIRILDQDGRHVRTVTRPFKARKVTKKDQEEWQEQRSREGRIGGAAPIVVMARSTVSGSSPASAAGSAPPPPTMKFTMDDVPFAEFMSVVTGIRTDPQGRIWVQRRTADGDAEGPIDLLTEAGRYIGTLPAQPLPDAVSASGLAAWVTTDDELGVERVVVRRLPAAWR